MNRTHLASAIRTLASGLGYTVVEESDDRAPQTITAFPSAWLLPLRLKTIEGRHHGRQTYSVELRVIYSAMKLSADKRAELHSRAEENLLELFIQLSGDDRVIAVQNLSIQPGTGGYTQHGELSQIAKADVITYF
ncbi:MAG TPA: hypothetical protein H9779_04165 [Candidatus Alistipes avicola]|uniref:Uncharacterized protein n=1 Tax=Candidatus Alistipes avicola TaxID=2838432 RepID=A0A9D2L2M4_9BACT|nr:hypothetical protein [uncultured Alistipes sp.]HJA98781.1 hypothetical protein [Candidatus Alistipes avicola]